MNAEQFDKSLNKSCGLLGTATMTFGSVSMLSCLMTIVGAIKCCKGDKKCSKPLDKEDDSSFMASFFLMIIAMLHHFMFWKYLKQKQEEALKESEEDHTTYTSVEMPVCGVPASVV
ncbi:hypothetical protein PF005_g31505 [Phytophthora fragariae]|uniref:Uncharacterized protein n=1 Tax=Phytophthora fragariae TaxID=53985 RepID=A0A6A3VBG0_9STRA|nr:hypothetical protein PF011_g30773 [Phytophthora fragariae]KAE9058979.1 hypothetical protein PF007_g31100 [Phytophthora fragariae]KAE9160782.1 hypothetical protein PF005_g31505 [Phytophthora fragariae]KAE9161646.1 hypothetical protein PF004_g30754 [Phytophthora fragariae]KAE9164262.1 hypothetical protein PF002_g31643 [Phytophthora fragariae]